VARAQPRWAAFGSSTAAGKALRPAFQAVDNNARSQRELQRELAEQIVKILRQNPAAATSYEYDRIVAAIAQYTLAQAEAR
jgi:hypothetical protein